MIKLLKCSLGSTFLLIQLPFKFPIFYVFRGDITTNQVPEYIRWEVVQNLNRKMLEQKQEQSINDPVILNLNPDMNFTLVTDPDLLEPDRMDGDRDMQF